MKHNIDELFIDNDIIRHMSDDDENDIEMPKIHMETLSFNINDLEVTDPVPDTLPILALRGAVLFPSVLMPITVSRAQSKKLLKEAERHQWLIGVVTQRNNNANPTQEDLYEMGCMARVMNVTNITDKETIAMLCGGKRFMLTELIRQKPYLQALVAPCEEEYDGDYKITSTNANVVALRRAFTTLLKNSQQASAIQSSIINSIDNGHLLINTIAAHAPIDVEQKQEALKLSALSARVEYLHTSFEMIRQAQMVQKELDEKVHRMMDQQQKEYYLNQQMHAIQEELGGSPYEKDFDDMQARAAKKHWDAQIAEHFARQLDKLRRIPPQQPDYFVEQNYLNFMLDLPWGEYTKDNLNIEHARKVLDRDHYGMEKIKDRILEYIAVMQLKGDLKSPILCLVGPPGTGKTSLGRSIADALQRKYVRMALGGVHDESEIRGHRRTYVGAMAGRVLQGLKRAGSSNPVFILDEIDKVQSNSFNGDPTAALLEVLDPEQNVAFHDNFLDLDYDLSKVLFIATANNLGNVQPALLDRMEIIDLSGYILEEKIEIAKRHLVPRLLKEHGFKASSLKFPPATLTAIINNYTQESGVRQLDKSLAKVIRRRAVKVVAHEKVPATVKESELQELLGLPLHQNDKAMETNRVGVVTGLAWTQVGGVVLFVEASLSKGKGTLSMTGNLGDVMKESATLAFEYLKSNAKQLGVATKEIESSHIHVHCPEGATPKDGPSAGITIFTAIVSVFTGRKVRRDVAMTGEITLRGDVTPIGGVKEKLLAAKRAGITHLVLSEDNRRDVEDINQEYLKGLQFHYIRRMEEVLPLALVK